MLSKLHLSNHLCQLFFNQRRTFSMLFEKLRPNGNPQIIWFTLKYILIHSFHTRHFFSSFHNYWLYGRHLYLLGWCIVTTWASELLEHYFIIWKCWLPPIAKVLPLCLGEVQLFSSLTNGNLHKEHKTVWFQFFGGEEGLFCFEMAHFRFALRLKDDTL